MNKNIVLPSKGKYVVAVSGGVDSVVLLHLLSKNSDTDIIVAHYDHGIREDSGEDLTFVKHLAYSYGHVFESEEGNLGKEASEALARKKRYDFLNAIKEKHNASAIITAHHQDDVIETCFINIIRGTGRRGISSLVSTTDIFRPLIDISKNDITNYANKNNLNWHEDSTNSDSKYLRNNLRLNIVNKLDNIQKNQVLKIISDTRLLNEKIDKEVAILLKIGLHKNQNVLNRKWFSLLPHDVSKEVIHAILTKMQAGEIDRKTVERTVVGIKTLPSGKTIQASGLSIFLTKRSARFVKSVAKSSN